MHRRGRWALGVLTVVCVSGLPVVLAACESDEVAGHTKTTTKRTVNTPDGKETTTTTREKTTEVTPK